MFTKISPKISAIPTSLITGFLGVGKTTAILKLLANKPKNENWAVLVNEFGEVGIDAALLNGGHNEKRVFIREVPGGCMCCASGVPMQVALNQLITKAKPDRLIIEPTGLGHPKEVVAVLTKGKYQDLISLQSIFCLVDARNLNDERYSEHPSFVQQLKIADIILAAKSDKYSAQDEENLSLFIAKNHLTDKALHRIQQGYINPSWLSQVRNKVITTLHTKPIIGIATPSLEDISQQAEIAYQNDLKQNDLKLNQALDTQLAEDGFIELNNQGEGYFSKGWIFSGRYIFDHQQLITLISSLNVARAKGVVVTDKGSFSFNKAGSEFSYNEVTLSTDSRIELIDTDESAVNNITAKQWLMLSVT